MKTASSWSEAQALRVPHYFTNRPCKRGHVEKRLSSTGQCLACMRVLQKDYYRDNPEKRRARSQVYRAEHPERVAQALRNWHELNPDWRGANRIKHQGSAREYSRKRYWERPEEHREASLAGYHSRRARGWVPSNKSKAQHTANRRARKLNATPPWFGEFDALVLVEAHTLRRLRQEVVGGRWEVDHRLPLRGRWVSGLHVGTNIQVIPKALNNRKSNGTALTQEGEWLKHL